MRPFHCVTLIKTYVSNLGEVKLNDPTIQACFYSADLKGIACVHWYNPRGCLKISRPQEITQMPQHGYLI